MEGKSLLSLREPRSPDLNLKKFADGIGVALDISPSQDRLPTLNDPQLESLAKHMRDYVQAPAIAFDESVTHPQRRDFSSLVANSKPELLPWLESNRLRYNNLVGIANFAADTSRCLSSDSYDCDDIQAS